MWSRYVYHLEANPVITKSLTAGALNALGDIIQQVGVQRVADYDGTRTLRMSAWAMLVPGPFLHFFYGALARRIPGTGVAQVAAKIALDQAIAAPIVLSSFFFITGLLAGNSLTDTTENYKKNIIPTLKANVMVWPAAQALNFAFVPTPWQPVYVSCVSLVWGIFLASKNVSSRKPSPAASAGGV